MNISVVGLGKVGAPLAAVLAHRGHTVVGVDVNAASVDRLNAGRAPVEEPQLQQLIDRHRARLRATPNYFEAIAATEATFVIVPTPSDDDGFFTNRYLIESLQPLGRALRTSTRYHLVVVMSTVMPGTLDRVLRGALEAASGRRVGPTLGLCYNPQFIALGSVIKNILAPDFVLIGESDSEAGARLQRIHDTVCTNTPPVRRMNFVNAELTKIAVNTYVTAKISYANMLAELCDRLPGADVDVVTAAVGSDSRIGPKYLRGALGYGGPCFPRDTVAFSALARRLGAGAELADATDRINRRQIDRLAAAVETRLGESRGTVGILGLSYKPDTDVIEASQGVALAARLIELGRRVVAYDPAAMTAASRVIPSATMTATAEACARSADVLVLTTPWPEFAQLSRSALARPGQRRCIIDCWRLLRREAFAEVADVVYPGQADETSRETAYSTLIVNAGLTSAARRDAR